MLDERTSAAPAKRTPLWKSAVYLVVALLVIAFMAVKYKDIWPKIAANPGMFLQLDAGMATLALLPLLLCSVVDTLIWNRTLSWFTDPLPFRQALPIYVWSSLARYVPGKVFSLALRAALATEVQREVVPVLASSTVELALRTASAVLVFLLLMMGGAHYHGSAKQVVLSIALIPFVLLCAHPKVMIPVMNWALKKMKHPPLLKPLKYREVLGLFVALALRWLLYGLGFALLASAVIPPLWSHQLACIGIAAGSWAVGFVTFMPGGAGTTEATQLELLTGPLVAPALTAMVLVILFRLATLLTEGAWAVVSLPIWRMARRMPVETPVPVSE